MPVVAVAQFLVRTGETLAGTCLPASVIGEPYRAEAFEQLTGVDAGAAGG
ncbi:hypothetical protein [Rhodococcus opacus]|nr:hypothetical protein [Rhodococcus opacus]